MSYARDNGIDSDVYVIRYFNFECFCENKFMCETREEMIMHLIKHLRNGDKVPDRTFERLLREIRSNEE